MRQKNELTPEEVKQAIVEFLARRNSIPADTDPEDVEVTADEEEFSTVEVVIDNGDEDGELPDFEDDEDEDDDAGE